VSEAEPDCVDFEAFVLETSEVFLRLAIAKAGNLHSAEDAVQTAYLRMFQHWEKLSGRQGSLTGYGRRAVENAVIDQFRKNGRLIVTPVHEIPDQPSGTGIPDAAYETVRESIDNLIAGLPERQREVLTLCVLQDISPAEVGKRLGLKEDSVKRYIKAAISKLKKAVFESSEEVTA